MSSESWSSSPDSPRLARKFPCAHVVDIADVKLSELSHKCPVCGSESAGQQDAFLDYVPTGDLTWREASCDKSEPLIATGVSNVCLLIPNLAVFVLGALL